MSARLAIAATMLAAAVATGIAGCSSGPATRPAAAESTITSSAPSPTIAATAPASNECTAFAQAYNGQVSPVLKGNGETGNVYLTSLTDAFTALAATTSAAADPYSQTITADAQAVAAAPTSYTALGTFNTDLAAFLKSCGMSSS